MIGTLDRLITLNFDCPFCFQYLNWILSSWSFQIPDHFTGLQYFRVSGPVKPATLFEQEQI